MSDFQFVALYAYETIQLTVKVASPCKLYRLTFANGQFDNAEVEMLTEQTLRLAPGVYGWFEKSPVAVAIDGHAILATMRKPSKDPWPPPPPPPVTPNFAQDPLATKLWALHWVGREGEAFLTGLEE